MGSLQLSCPLCCNEIFETYGDLKIHILAVIDNLSCPACKIKFDNILDLAEHVGRECCGDDVDRGTEFVDVTVDVKNEKAGVSKESIIRNEIDFEVLLNESILAKALLGNEKEVKTEEVTDKEECEEVDDNHSFYCSSCAISFSSVEQHLQEYHEGHEVILDEGISEVFEEEVNAHEDEDEIEKPDETVYIVKDEDSSVLKDDVELVDDLKSTFKKTELKSLDTLEQRECFDKDGRVYTRKVVRIEKFWDENNLKNKEPPIIDTFLLEDNKAIKLTEEEAELVEDKTKVIQIYQCKTCTQQYSKLELYLNHNCLQNQDKFKCTKCYETFTNSRTLSLHMKKHKTSDSDGADSNTNICEICNTEFPTYKSLRLHKRMHDPVKIREIEAPVSYGITGETNENSNEPREMFVCNICHKTYDIQYKAVHMNFHTEENNFDCDICNRKFYTKTNLEMHMRVHSNGKKFTCSYCKKGFLTYENMNDHVANHCQKRRYECQYCGRRFARPHEKVKHERIHTGEKPHICEICGKAFRVSYCLTLHMRTHSGTRPYQCSHCGKRFKAHSVFNHHLLTHSDERNYKCPYCPKAFKTGVQLAGHKNSHIKPFTCTECNRPFASLYAVRSHMDTHKRENNLKYSCYMCGASYARAFALRDHIKEQHPEGDVNKSDIEMLEVEEEIDASNAILQTSDENMLIELEHGTVETVVNENELTDT